MTAKTILVVEDEAVVAMELRSALEQMGYKVAPIARSSEDAIRFARELTPDLVLMDIRLTGSSDGIQAADVIRERYDIPVVYLTAHADDKTLQRAKLTEPFGYLVKPFSEPVLRTTIEVSLHKHLADMKSRSMAKSVSTTLGVLGGAVIGVDIRTGLIEFMNSVATVLTGWKQQDAVGQPLQEVFVLKDPKTQTPVEDPIPQSLKPGSITGSSHYLLAPRHEEEIDIETRVIPTTDSKGEVAGAVLAFQDVSQDVWPDQDWFSYAVNLCLDADHARSCGEYATAESRYERALMTLVKHYGTDHPKVARVLEDLADVFHKMGNTQAAQQSRARAFEIRKSSPV